MFCKCRCRVKSSGTWGIRLSIKTSASALMSRCSHDSGTLSSQGLSLPHPRLNARCSRSYGLAQAGGFLWRWDLRLQRPSIRAGSQRPSPNTLCVFRPPVGRPSGGDPTYTMACCAGPEFSRVASTTTQPRRDATASKQFPLFEHRPLR